MEQNNSGKRSSGGKHFTWEERVRLETLTPREHDVLTHVIAGTLNKQIAAELGISEDTVKSHRGRVMQKFEVVSVAELVRLCEKAGVAPARERSHH
jgi:FixJ family two-component response regulator